MKFASKVIIAVEFSDQLPGLLMPLKQMGFLTKSEIHFVYVVRTTTFAFGVGEIPLVYPIQEDRKVLEQSGLALLTSVTEKILPQGFEGKIVQKILFDDDPKGRFSRYVNEEHASLVIILTKQKHGLFESSFAQYVNKHTNCNMIFLKHNS